MTATNNVLKPPDPTSVASIYRPKHFSFNKKDPSCLLPFGEMIRVLKRSKEFMGITAAPCKDGKFDAIYITCSQPSLDERYFCAAKLKDRTCLGIAKVHPFMKSNKFLKNFWKPQWPSNYKGYGLGKEPITKVLLTYVSNDSREHDHIGVILIKAIQQRFKKVCDGRMILTATGKIHPYFYKLGFRSTDPEKNKIYAEYKENKKIPDKNFESETLYLPEEACKLWNKEIEEYPIFFPVFSSKK
jgi:hypothetical protein